MALFGSQGCKEQIQTRVLGYPCVCKSICKLKNAVLEQMFTNLQDYSTFIIWLQKYARSDWLLSGHYFLVMTGHHENSFQC